MLTVHERQRTGQCGLIKTLRPDTCLNYECLLDLVALLESSVPTGSAVVLDLIDTRYVDSSGIAALLHIVRHLQGAERLQIIHCDSAVNAIFKKCHLDRWVTIHH